MKICYIANSKSTHTLSFAKYFAEKGNNVYILDFNTNQDDILEGRINIYTIEDPEERLVRYKKRSLGLAFKEQEKTIELNSSFTSKVKVWIELAYAWLVGHVRFIPRLPQCILKLPLNSELIQMDRYAAKAKKLLDEIKPDIVHTIYLTSYGYIAVRTGFNPLVSSPMGSDVFLRPKEGFFNRMRLLHTIKRSNVITSNSNFLLNSLEKFGANRMKIRELIWGCDTKKFFPLKRISHLPPTIIHTRKLAPLYNVESFLKALPLVSKSTPDLKVFLRITGPLQSEIESMIEKLDLESIVILLDWLSEDELASHYRSSHIYVSLSKSDSTSVSLLEAMASGCFPIVSDIPANREWIEDGINGFIVPTDDPRILADRIIQTFENRELRLKAAKQNVETIKSRAMWEDQAKNLEDYYRRLINSGAI